MDSKVINTLREQMFEIFIDSFDKETLKKNGFPLTDTEDPKNHLKRRTKSLNSIYDIYNLGLSLWEKQIVNKMSEILKSPPSQNIPSQQLDSPPKSNIIDTHSKEILEKLQDITRENLAIRNENKQLKHQIQQMEKKLDTIISKMSEGKSKTYSSLPPPTSEEILPEPFTRINIMENPTTEQHHKNFALNTTDFKTPSSYADMASRKPVNPPPPSQMQHNHRKTNPITKPKITPIFGDKSPTNDTVMGKLKPYSLFIGGFNPNLNTNDIANIIEDTTGIKVIDITQNRANKYNQSVRVDINFKDKEKALSPNTWFQGLIIKPFRHRKSNYHHLNMESYENQNTRQNQKQSRNIKSRYHHNNWNNYDNHNTRHHYSQDSIYQDGEQYEY